MFASEFVALPKLGDPARDERTEEVPANPKRGGDQKDCGDHPLLARHGAHRLEFAVEDVFPLYVPEFVVSREAPEHPPEDWNEKDDKGQPHRHEFKEPNV